jgi:hypothetical protein
MEQSVSYEANSRSASQNIPRILWAPKFQYRPHKGPAPDSTPRQINPVTYSHALCL